MKVPHLVGDDASIRGAIGDILIDSNTRYAADSTCLLFESILKTPGMRFSQPYTGAVAARSTWATPTYVLGASLVTVGGIRS
jgi:hypothetical protein